MNIVLAMNMGGDNFINKPFDLQVVQAKLQALLRRTYSFSKDFHLLTYQDVHLDILAGKITYQQKELILTKLEDIGLHDFIHTKKGLGYLLCLKTI